MDIKALENALDKDSCSDKILEETSESVADKIVQAIKPLHLPSYEMEKTLRALKGYRYIGQLDDLEYGAYVRWINLDRGKLKLTNGGFVIEVKIDDVGPAIVCKQHLGKVFQFHFNRCLAFQKLTQEEIIILRALQLAKTRKHSPAPAEFAHRPDVL